MTSSALHEKCNNFKKFDFIRKQIMVVAITKSDFADIFIAFSFDHINDEKRNFAIFFVRVSAFWSLN